MRVCGPGPDPSLSSDVSAITFTPRTMLPGARRRVKNELCKKLSGFVAATGILVSPPLSCSLKMMPKRNTGSHPCRRNPEGWDNLFEE